MKFKEILGICILLMLTTVTTVKAQYPNIPDSVKHAAEELMKAAEEHSDMAS